MGYPSPTMEIGGKSCTRLDKDVVAYNLRERLQHFRTAAKLLERIGDHAEKIALAVINLEELVQNKAFLVRLESAVQLSLDILEKAFTALMVGDLEMANEALEARGWLSLTVEELPGR